MRLMDENVEGKLVLGLDSCGSCFGYRATGFVHRERDRTAPEITVIHSGDHPEPVLIKIPQIPPP